MYAISLYNDIMANFYNCGVYFQISTTEVGHLKAWNINAVMLTTLGTHVSIYATKW